MKKIKSWIVRILLIIFTCLIGITIIIKCNKREADNFLQEEITWTQNEDGSYTFTNHAGNEDSIFAWYVLSDYDEIIFKTMYTHSPEFTYDLEGNRDYVIKGFVRTGTADTYDQISIKVPATDILGLKTYSIETTTFPSNGRELLNENLINSGNITLPLDAVIAGNGSAWETDLHIPVDWNCSNITNRSYGFAINGLLFLDDTYRIYLDAKEEQYGKLIISYMVDWATQNKEYVPENKWAWHDDATALRVFRMSIFYDALVDLCTKEEKIIIENSLNYQANLLASNEFYTSKHNHGMHQDIALLTYTLLFLEGESQYRYIEKALSRTGEYFDYVYTKDGVHKEHSPFYARDVLRDIIFLRNMLQDISPEFSEHISNYIEGAQEYLIQIIKPDGTWPSLGDSSKANGISSMTHVMKDNKKYLYLMSNGTKGIPPKNSAVFQEGGYAISRSSWEDSADTATWVLFNASTFSSTHKHGDDLEVLLYHKGDLFVEAGKHDYNYSEPYTAWAYSGYAHNVLLVDEEAYPVKIGSNGFQSIYPDALRTQILDYSIDSDVFSVTGSQCRFQGIEQTRILHYDRNSNFVAIEDHIEADHNYDGALLWHIAEGVEVKEDTNGWEIFRNGVNIAHITVTGNVDFELETITGVKQWPYCTIIFDGNSEPTYSTLLKINFNGTSGLGIITTKVDLY